VQAATREILYAERSFSNESAGKEMAACLADNGNVECYFPTPASAERNGSLFLSAPALLAALEQCLPYVDRIRAMSGGDGDLTALTARTALQLARGGAQ